ncbi:unnamed protein product [Parascedosporium putredinis]|uniref:Trichothecene 3-O-acetyltransferase-like N-terminal domain-containing protein n=1 Tax=Parascedosporium putredinis TaxID=1442378 RepID=A0A9P1H348_9PEZI|nr:unnamed protein product [Parascedosporium putredinis]CAI7994220.1 unnamed protein product [Parascedosporium putredinis]
MTAQTTSSPTGNTTGLLDIFGQQPFLDKLYTQITLCYPSPDDVSVPHLTETLEGGLRTLAASFPWVAGQVVHEPVEGGTGIYRFAPLDPTPRLVVKDLRGDASAVTMAQLREARFPMSMLDESVVAPRNTLTLPGTPEAEQPAPVFLVQVTLVQGGALLTFVAQHNVVDMGGQARIMALLAKACAGEAYTPEEIEGGNTDRENVIPYLTTRFVSTDDCVTALIWQATTRARVPRIGANAPTTLARAIDVRRYLGLPDTYPGVTQSMTYHTVSQAEDLASSSHSPVGAVASGLRTALGSRSADSDIAFRTRAFATVLARSPNKMVLGVTAMINPSHDIMLSSWANRADFFEHDFGLGLGTPEAVRRPRFMPFESLMYLMPRKKGAEIVAALSLREEDMERLKTDAEFAKYATYIG